MQYEFAYSNYIHEVKDENGIKKYKTKTIRYRADEHKTHLTLKNDVDYNNQMFKELLNEKNKNIYLLFTCLNDKIDHSRPGIRFQII